MGQNRTREEKMQYWGDFHLRCKVMERLERKEERTIVRLFRESHGGMTIEEIRSKIPYRSDAEFQEIYENELNKARF